jgi:hypothetical protein
MKNVAPVLIPTLNRYDHFKSCIDSLSLCTYADQTDLYISLDYPLTEKHWEGYRKIDKYLKDICGFKSVNIIKRETNFGPVKNLFDSIATILKTKNTLIISEDDNVFSIDFLQFMNLNLEVFKDRKDIFSISGYNYPIDIPERYQNEIYIWTGFSAWGCGIWKDKWEKVDFTEDIVFNTIQKFLTNLNKVWRFNKIANHYVPSLIHVFRNKVIYGDCYLSMWQFSNKMHSVFPSISRVRNMGHDGSGVNCGIIESNIYRKQEIYSGNNNYTLSLDIQISTKINHVLKNYFKRSLSSQFKTFIKLLLMKLGIINLHN